MRLRYIDDTKTMMGHGVVTVICEIPIYGTSQDKYNEYWHNKADEHVQHSLTISPNRTDINQLREVILRNAIWKYNQIIGFIRISVGTQDINFEDFHSFKRYQRDSNAKHLIEFNRDFHFYTGNMKTNAEIISNIKKHMNLYIRDIRKRHPKFYVDTSAFDNIIDYIDIKAIISELGGGTINEQTQTSRPYSC